VNPERTAAPEPGAASIGVDHRTTGSPGNAVEEVGAMPEAVNSGPKARLSRVTLNSDGQRHPVQNMLTLFTFVIGILALAIGFIVRAHVAGTVIGIVGFVVGLYAQMISSTREQRIFIMAGIIAAFVGMGLAIAHGGFG
jgi:hypothetical protein